MRYRLRTLSPLRLHVARGFIASILILVLLGGVAPFSTLSASAVCEMECCVGLAPHEAGSCHLSMAAGTPEPDAPKSCAMTEAFGEVTGGAMGMGDPRSSFDAVTIDASDHCSRKSTEEGASAPSANGLPAPTSLAAQFLTKPCPPECGTGAVSFAQLQRSRETAALARALRPRPPTVSLQSRFIEVNLFTAIAWQKRIRPRGPPLSFS